MSIPFSVQDIISRDGDTNDLENVTVCSKVELSLDGRSRWTTVKDRRVRPLNNLFSVRDRKSVSLEEIPRHWN